WIVTTADPRWIEPTPSADSGGSVTLRSLPNRSRNAATRALGSASSMPRSVHGNGIDDRGPLHRTRRDHARRVQPRPRPAEAATDAQDRRRPGAARRWASALTPERQLQDRGHARSGPPQDRRERDPDLDQHRTERRRHAAVPPLPQRVQERAVAV